MSWKAPSPENARFPGPDRCFSLSLSMRRETERGRDERQRDGGSRDREGERESRGVRGEGKEGMDYGSGIEG